MFEKYRQWIANASDHAIIGNRALILLGDSLEVLDDGGAAQADAVICDPPYDFDASGGPSLFKRDSKNYFNTMRDKGLADGFDIRILEKASRAPSMAVFFHNDQLAAMARFFDEANYDRTVLCGWNKTNPMPVANKHYIPDTELYIHAWRNPAFPQGAIEDKRRFIFAPVGKSEWDHPTVKPQRVMRKIVTNASQPGDVVLDPFSGSGSTGVAALALGRYYIGIEKDPEFFELSKERLSLAAQVQYENAKTPTLF